MHSILLISVFFFGISCKDRTSELKAADDDAYNQRVRWSVASVREDFAKAKPVKVIFKEAADQLSSSEKQKGLDRILGQLKKNNEHEWIFENIASIYASKSLSSEDVSFPHIRIVAFSENRIIAFTTKPEGKFYDFVEIIEYRDGRYQFDFLDYSPDQHFANMNSDKTCGGCHGQDPNERRPIYGGYDFWPAFMEADGGFPTYPNYSHLAAREKATLQNLCKSYHSKIGLSTRLEFFRPGISNYCEDNGLGRHKYDETPYDAGVGRTRGFQRELAKMQSLRFYEQLSKPELQPFYAAFAGVLLKCNAVEWFGEDAREKLAEIRTDTTNSVAKEIERRAELYFRLNIDGFDRKKLSMHDRGDNLAPKYLFEYPLGDTYSNGHPKLMTLGLVDFPRSHLERIEIVSRLRFVAEAKAGLNLETWSTSRRPAGSSYELSQNGQGDELMQDVFGRGMLDLALKPIGKSQKDYVLRAGYGHIGSFDSDGYPKEDRVTACKDLKTVFDSTLRK